MSWIIFTPEQNAAALDHNEGQVYLVVPRLVDLSSHEEFGNYVAPARVAEGPDYGPVWGDFLADHRRMEAHPDDLFLPPEEVL